MAAATPKFIADEMLGRLARWLRLLGIDTVYDPHLDDAELIRRAARESRILLTRDTRLLRRRGLPPTLFVTDDHFRDQLRQVASAFALDFRGWQLKRCSRCNELLAECSHADVRDRVPAYVLRTQTHFLECPRCRRVYWAATHVERMRAEIAQLFGRRPAVSSKSEPVSGGSPSRS